MLIENSSPLKFLAYNPLIGRSHVTYVGKIAEVLVEAGHEVVMLAPLTNPTLNFHGTSKARLITVPQCPFAAEFAEKAENELLGNMWDTKGAADFFHLYDTLSRVWAAQCNATVHHPGLLEQLRAEKFDVAFAEQVDLCGFGLIKMLGIEKYALTFSVGSFEGSFEISGMPSSPSYVPGAIAGFGDKMTFFERVMNAVSFAIVKIFIPRMHPYYEQVFQEIDPNFPSMMNVMANSSLFFINSDTLTEFPRPTIHKVIEIGGISVASGHNPLNKTWDDILNIRRKTVLLSFGSAAKSSQMPAEYKKTFRETFRKFPDVTFIWKYEVPEDDIGKGIKNIIPVTWVPQNDILYDRRLSAFITHGGAGSITESTTAGVPLIVIPLMGDQLRNAQVVKRIGTGIVLDRTALEHATTLEDAIRAILTEKSYLESARRTSEMIADRPFPVRDILVRNMEFIGEFGPLRNLDHYGRHLNFIQYYLIDVIVFVVVAVILAVALAIYLIWRALRALFSLVWRRPETKKKEE